MAFDPIVAEIRFGCGLSPSVSAPVSVSQKLSLLTGPDHIAVQFPIPAFAEFHPWMVEKHELFQVRRKNRGTETAAKARKDIKLLQKHVRREQMKWLGMAMLRRAYTGDGLRERLAFFWADHFTAVGKNGLLRRATSPYVEEAIRPHLTGKFADMLVATVTQPLMLHYLDQQQSVGPNSDKAMRRRGKAGLNENLARELLELHTLGVDGPYDQQDVRQLAELLTGLTYHPRNGFTFRKDMAEPGAETVLGRAYGGAKQAQLGDVIAALHDIARHPSTAANIAQKLAVHFVSDTPDAGLVADLTAVFRESEGDLLAVYRVLLEHPKAWNPAGGNVKQPVDFIGSSMRALAIEPAKIPLRDEREMRNQFVTPMVLMGQPWERPGGPDGWPEDDADWVTPQRIAARIEWAMTMPTVLRPDLPDPRDFVEVALGGAAPEVVRFAAESAETRADGIGLVLASPAFQRM